MVPKPSDRRNEGPRAGIEHDPRRDQLTIACEHPILPIVFSRKSTTRFYDGQAAHRTEPVLEPGARLIDARAHASHCGTEVDFHWTGANAELPRTTRQVGDARGFA